jgi:hypothetical protein
MTPQETIAHLQSQLDECRKERQARELAEGEAKRLREELKFRDKMEDLRFELLPEPKNPTLWRYIQSSFENGVIDFHIRVERMSDGGFKFYIHAAQASSSTEDFYIWPDPFNWHDMVANTKDIPEPDVESFKKALAKAKLAPAVSGERGQQ